MYDKLNLMKYYLKAFKQATNFDGRASRREYWMFVLYNILIPVAIIIFSAKLCIVYSLVVAIPSLSLSIRRLHDIGKSGWNWLFSLIPIVGQILFIYWCCLNGEERTNKWGTVIEDDTQLTSPPKKSNKKKFLLCVFALCFTCISLFLANLVGKIVDRIEDRIEDKMLEYEHADSFDEETKEIL